MLTDKIIKLLKENNVKLDLENVIVAYKDGTVSVSFDEESRSIKIDVEFVDRVIHVEDKSIEHLIEEGE